MKAQNRELRNRERQRDRSNLRGALAPPLPCKTRTRGETLLPYREKVKEEEGEGGLSPPLSQWCLNAVGAIIITLIYTNTSVIFTDIFITLPHLSIVVHSPATRYTLYLNMVLYASYYYPMTCCHPMMSE